MSSYPLVSVDRVKERSDRGDGGDGDDDDNDGGDGHGDDEGSKRGITLDWRDYVALFIALLQTVALPMLLLIAVILATLVVLRLL
jgi:hypothetical protein